MSGRDQMQNISWDEVRLSGIKNHCIFDWVVWLKDPAQIFMLLIVFDDVSNYIDRK
jgi:hypothetical protein